MSSREIDDLEDIEEVEEVESSPPQTPLPFLRYNKKRDIQAKEGRDWDCMERIFLKDDSSDCHIVLDSKAKAKYPCLTAIISSSSQYFANKFKESDNKVLIIRDIKEKVMTSVLEYVYFGWCELEDYNFACSVLEVARKFTIEKLVSFCEGLLINQITLRNLCYILNTAIVVKSECLKSACLKVCGEGAFVILSTRAFLNTTPEAVRLVLSLPRLQVLDDMMIFRALWDWATYKCCKLGILLNDGNTVAEMSQFFEFIGFEFMSKSELKSLPKAVFKKFRKLFPNIVLDLPKDEDYTESEMYKSSFPDWKKKMFLNEDFSDCEILVDAFGSSARFPCHRNILAPSSATLAKSLEKPSQEKRKVTVNDVKPMTMYAMLKYIYSGDVEFESARFACELLHAAVRYKVLPLIIRCEKYLAIAITAGNVCHVLKTALAEKSENVKKACSHCIASTPLSNIMSTKAFLEFDTTLMTTLFSMPSLRSRDTEYLVLKALWRWSTVLCCKVQNEVTDSRIWNQLDKMMQYINFDFLLDEDLERVPEDFLKKLREKAPHRKVVPEEDKTKVKGGEQRFVRPSEKRKMDFPVKLNDYVRRFFAKETRSPDLSLKGNIILFSFTINIDAYLILLGITLAESPSRSKLQSLHVYSRHGTPCYFDRAGEDTMDRLVLQRSHRVDLSFIPKRLAVIEANEVYNVEVNRGEGDCDFNWPRTELENDIHDDLILTIHTEHSYGLARMNFVPVS